MADPNFALPFDYGQQLSPDQAQYLVDRMGEEQALRHMYEQRQTVPQGWLPNPQRFDLSVRQRRLETQLENQIRRTDLAARRSREVLERGLLDQGLRPQFDPEGTLTGITAPPELAQARLKPPPTAVTKGIEAQAGRMEGLAGLVKGFSDEYGGYVAPIFGEIANIYGSYLPMLASESKQAQGQWWRDYRALEELFRRHEIFGATFTPGEQQAWERTSINPGLPGPTVRRYLTIRLGLLNNAMRRSLHTASKSYRSEPLEAAAGGVRVPQGPVAPTTDLNELARQGSNYATGRRSLEELYQESGRQ